MTAQPRPFELHRDTDISGVSGTGKVAEGIIFSDGHAAIHWLGTWPTTTPHPSIASIKAVHGHGGSTRIVLTDNPTDRLARIAEAHRKTIGEHGLTDGLCAECGQPWGENGCPTYVWATTDRDPLATWDPADDD